jgi:LPXTG-motif cell wall-anchored protein
VPSVCRRIVVLLVVALLGAAVPVTAAHAQGAGDQQYEDPFGGSGSSGSSGSGSSGRSGSSGSGDSGAQPLTQAPQTSGSGSSGSRSSGSGSGSGSGSAAPSTSGTATAPAAATPQASGTLPNTGLDARVLVLAGVVLVVAGLGLRLRNAPERF